MLSSQVHPSQPNPAQSHQGDDNDDDDDDSSAKAHIIIDDSNYF